MADAQRWHASAKPLQISLMDWMRGARVKRRCIRGCARSVSPPNGTATRSHRLCSVQSEQVNSTHLSLDVEKSIERLIYTKCIVLPIVKSVFGQDGRHSAHPEIARLNVVGIMASLGRAPASALCCDGDRSWYSKRLASAARRPFTGCLAISRQCWIIIVEATKG